MFANRPWKELVIRTLLIAVMFFNALAPAAASAKSPTAPGDLVDSPKNSSGEKQDGAKTLSPAENNFYQPRFPRPVSRIAEKVQRPEDTLAQTSDATLVCYSSNCSDSGPGVVLTELVDEPESVMGWHYFQVQCVGGPCEKKDVFWRVSATFTIDNLWNNPHTVGFDKTLSAEVQNPNPSSQAEVTGNVEAVFCGYATFGYSTTCVGVTSGVIPAELFNDNPDNRYFLIAVAAHSVSYTDAYRQGVIQVSFNPKLLDSQLPPDFVNCKDCPFSGATGWAADPINTNTGAMSYKENDLEIPTSAGLLSFKRTYVSSYVNRFTAPLGYGWIHNQDMRLIFPETNEPGFVHFKDQSGNLYRFWDMGTGSYIPYAGYTATLTKNSGPPITYTLTNQAQDVFTFDEDGKITSLTNSTGQVITYDYDTSGRLERVSADGTAHFLDFSYNAQGQLETVTDHADHADRSIAFGYDATTGDLISYTDVLHHTWHYEYQNHLLTRIEDPDGHLVERNEYYSNGKTSKQFDGNDNLDHPIAELTYNSNGTTTVTDALGNDVTHTYDARNTLTGDANYFGQTQKAYDSNFRPTSIQDALGNPPTTLEWSEDGANLKSITDGLNNETSISYNSSNNPTSIVDPFWHETKYFYTDTNFPTLPTRIEYPLSFDNGETYIGTDYEYYPPSSGASAGKVKLVTDALRRETYYTYTSSGQLDTITTADQTTDYDYDDSGRLVRVIDPAGVITRNKYDVAGRLIVTIQNVDPSTPDAENPPQNLVSGDNIYNLYTRYYYDIRDNQLAVVDTDWNITRTYYDLANRPIGVVQNLVINDTPADSDAEVLTTISTPLGSMPAYTLDHPDRNIQTGTVYDDAGNVIDTRDPQGIITHNSYDEASRLILTIQNFVGTGAYDPAYPDQNIRTEYFYDANNNLIATRDTLDVITRTYFDELNRPTLIVQNWVGNDLVSDPPPSRAAGQCGSVINVCTENFYDKNGNLIATRDPNGVVTRTYYDALNRPITVVQNLAGQGISEATPPERDPNALTAAASTNIRTDTWYDKVGNVVATVDPRGVWTRTYYDLANRPVATIQNWTGSDLYGDLSTAPAYNPAVPDANIRTTIAYNPDGYRDTTTDPLGRVTKYVYNDVGQLLKVTANYVNGGVPQNEDDQRNIVTQYAYDAFGRQIKTTDTSGRVALNAYDDLGRVTSVTQNYLQGQAQNYRDASGDQYNLITTFLYDVRGNQIAVTDTAGVITRTYYDALGRSVTVVRNLVGQDPLIAIPPGRANPPSSIENLRTDTVYLGTGSVDYVIDEMGKTTDYSYDSLGRLISVFDPLSNVTDFEYDANGNRTLMIDAEGITTKYEYDPLSRLKAVVENYRTGVTPDHETNVHTSYTYDANGNRLSIRDGKSYLDGIDYRTTFTYDALGRLETETDPLGHTTTYEYDAMGNRVSLLDANGATTSYDYDELNRLVLIDYPAPDADVTFDYDALGHRQSMSDGLGTTTWDYNNLDMPNSITDPFSANVSYDYDEAGNRTKLTYPDNSEVNYQYNAINRLTEVLSGQQPAVSYQYDAAGHVKMIERPNGVNTLYNYYDNGWLQDITHSTEAETLASYEYLYDKVGNRRRAIENVLFPSLPPTATPTATQTETETPTSTATSTATPVTYMYTSQPDGALGLDTYLLSASAATNYGTDVGLGVGENNNTTDWVARALIKFDVSSIPANAVITSATLSLWTSGDYSDNDRTIRVYRLKTAFDESNATWNESAASVNWETAGASGANDRESADIGSTQILAGESLGIEKQIALTPSKIQEFVSGTFTNSGFIIIADTELDDRFNYESSDSVTASNRPKLVIQYTLPQGRAPSNHLVLANFAAPLPQVADKALLAPAHAYQEESTATPTATFTPTSTATPSYGYWNFDEGTGSVAHDLGSGAHDGTINGAAAWVNGYEDDALQFNGTDTNVTIIDVSDPTAYTFAAWVKPTAFNQNIFVRTDASGPYASWSHNVYINSNGNFCTYVFGGDHTVCGATVVDTATPRWYHVAATASNNGQLRLYVNGIQEGVPANVGTLWQGGDRYLLGSGSSGLGAFAGVMDEVHLFDSVLSPAEIGVLYNSSQTPSPTPTETPTQTSTSTPSATATASQTSAVTATPRLDDAYTVSLLHMNGADGATAFTDEAGKTWNAVGNTQIDTAQSKFGEASVFFDGSGDYLETSDHEDFNIGADDFTVDWWGKRNATHYGDILGQRTSTDQITPFAIYSNGSQYLLYMSSNGTSWDIYGGVIATVDNAWHHYAIVRSGGTIYKFVDGVLVGTHTITTGTFYDSASPFRIGGGGGWFYNGWIDEFRFSKGIARWTTHFIPPSSEYAFDLSTPTPTPTTNLDDTYTISLLHMNGTDGSNLLMDESRKTWISGGNAQVDTAQSKFGGGSIFFDGSGDYLETSDHEDFNIGAEDFTVDWWGKQNAPSYGDILGQRAVPGQIAPFAIMTNYGQYLLFMSSDGASWNEVNGGVIAIADDAWHHYAIVRSGGTIYKFVDGVLVGTHTITTGTFYDSNAPFRFGGGNVWFYNGWIDEFRFSKGIARWTTHFVPPSSEYALDLSTPTPTPTTNLDDTYTSSLLHMNGTDGSMLFRDESRKTWIANGNAQIDTAQSEFAGTSGRFDGSGDYLDIPDQEDFNVGAGDFTVDFWMRPSVLSGNQAIMAQSNMYASETSRGLQIMVVPSGTNYRIAGYLFYGSGSNKSIVGTTNLEAGTWYHVALVRNDNLATLYLNGVSEGQVDVTGIAVTDSPNKMALGRLGEWNGYYFNGWLDEFRFSKGIARWTTHFTPPTAEYDSTTATSTPTPTSALDDTYTTSLLHMNGTDASRAFMDEGGSVWTAMGSARLDTDQFGFGGASGLFDGSGDYLETFDNANFDVGSGDFTVDFWMNLPALSGNHVIMAQSDMYSSATSRSLQIMVVPNATNYRIAGYLFYGPGSYKSIVGTTNLQAGTWYHVALVRNGDLATLYLNGASEGLVDVTGITVTNSPNKMSIGRLGEWNGYYFNGWLDEFRFSKGIARWTSDFTPPTFEYVFTAETPVTTPTVTPTAASLPVTNFARGKAAIQSSTVEHPCNPSAEKAVDGNTTPNFLNCSVTHTNADLHAWWEVDLDQIVQITNIKLWNRSEDSGRLSNYYVFVSDVPFTSTDLDATLNQSGVSSFHQTGEAGRPTIISINRTGRYVRVQLAGTNYLTLTEVQVWGVAPASLPINLALDKPAAQSSTYSNPCDPVAGKAVDGSTDGAFGNCSVSATNADAHAWWEVDLGWQGYISTISVWNQIGEFTGLRNYYIFVSDVPFASTDLDTTLQQPGVSAFHQIAIAGWPTTVVINRTGRYVRLQQGNSPAGIWLAEVEVWGVWGDVPPTTPTATSTPSRTPTPTKTPTPSRTPTGSPAPFISPTPVTGLSQTIIDYDYDPLYRLTAADYSNGDYYHYTYDAVGNRLEQERSIIGLVTTDTYLYDDANRLTSVNGVTYIWDNNGNLLNDGVNAYTYDSANRLKTMTGPSVAASYGYNGLNDRLQETVNGQTTAFTMDLNAGLTQALSDGTNTYIYGNERLAQVNTGTEYFLGDALGSVRQLTNNSGAVTYASAYDPYGVTTQAYGASQTAYGYTNEYTDSYIKLIYLRSRWYDPQTGRFPTRDSWQRDYNRPLSLNRWSYVEGNPINLTDPTGRTPHFQCDWPNLYAKVLLNGKWWTIDNTLCKALDDPAAPLKLIEDFYRVIVANGLRAAGAPDAALLLLRSLDGKTSPYQVSGRLGKQLMELPSHKEHLKLQENLFLQKLKIEALIMKCGESKPIEYSSPALQINGYDPYGNKNVTFAMADHTAWFTWEGTINRKEAGDWFVFGTFQRDLADYSDWHGAPHDYNGDGKLECPGGQCYKTASFPLPWNLGTVTIPDDWMARLVIGGEASNPGFGIYFNSRQTFWIRTNDWTVLPKVNYLTPIDNGNGYLEPEHELQATFGPP